MLAIDTNVLVRFVIDDDPQQAKAARALVGAHQILVSSTVLLEAEWVLRNGYGLPRRDALQALGAVCGLPGVTVDDPDRVANALRWSSEGLDFADALHLAAAVDCEAFATFDRKLAKRAGRAESVPIRRL